MFWKILLVLVSLADKIIDRLVPMRKEKKLDDYMTTSREILERQKKRNEKQRQAGEAVKARLDDLSHSKPD